MNGAKFLYMFTIKHNNPTHRFADDVAAVVDVDYLNSYDKDSNYFRIKKPQLPPGPKLKLKTQKAAHYTARQN